MVTNCTTDSTGTEIGVVRFACWESRFFAGLLAIVRLLELLSGNKFDFSVSNLVDCRYGKLFRPGATTCDTTADDQRARTTREQSSADWVKIYRAPTGYCEGDGHLMYVRAVGSPRQRTVCEVE